MIKLRLLKTGLFLMEHKNEWGFYADNGDFVGGETKHFVKNLGEIGFNQIRRNRAKVNEIVTLNEDREIKETRKFSYCY